MIIKGPLSEEFNVTLADIVELKVADLVQKLPDSVKSRDIAFVSGGLVLDPSKSLNEYQLDENSTVYYLVKKKSDIDTKSIAQKHVPTNLNECVKSFRVLIDQFGMPFGEKMKQMLQNEESFNTLLNTVPGVQEDTIVVKMLKDIAILSHYVKKENIAAIKDQHPALLCAINYINTQLSSVIETLTAMQTIFGHSRDYEDDYEEEDEYFDDLMDTDSTQFATPNFPPAPTDAAGVAANRAAQASNSNRLTADLIAQALDNVMARRSGGGAGSGAMSSDPPLSFHNPLASSSSQPGAATAGGSGGTSTSYVPEPEQVRQLCELGIGEDRAFLALTRTRGNFDQALDLLFNGDI